MTKFDLDRYKREKLAPFDLRMMIYLLEKVNGFSVYMMAIYHVKDVKVKYLSNGDLMRYESDLY